MSITSYYPCSYKPYYTPFFYYKLSNIFNDNELYKFRSNLIINCAYYVICYNVT